MKVTTMTWGTDHEPPNSELMRVLNIIEQGTPVLIHCSVGKHRTGYAVAAYRILHQNWTFEQAFQDMVEHGYVHNDRPVFEEGLQALFANMLMHFTPKHTTSCM
jgi:protein tyrosine/serine phosphatase